MELDEKKLKLGIPKNEGQLSMMFTRGGPREGAGRKSIGKTKKVSLTLSQEIWDELDKRCSQQHCSRSELLRGMIESCLTK